MISNVIFETNFWDETKKEIEGHTDSHGLVMCLDSYGKGFFWINNETIKYEPNGISILCFNGEGMASILDAKPVIHGAKFPIGSKESCRTSAYLYFDFKV